MKRYGYHRTSTREQHLDRGIKVITAYCEQNNLGTGKRYLLTSRQKTNFESSKISGIEMRMY